MSSILKALKRIEGESPPQQSIPSLPGSVDPKPAVSSNARRRWLFRRIITVSLILLVIVAAAILIYHQRQFIAAKLFSAESPAAKPQKEGSPGKKTNIFRAKIPHTSSKQIKRRPGPTRLAKHRTKTAAPGQNTKVSRKDVNPQRPAVAVDRQPPKPMPAILSKQPQSGITGHKPARKQPSRQKFRPSKKSIAGKHAASTKSAAGVQKPRKARSYAKLNDSKLKLQALAWSSDAARRMAVINGRIVREGESVDGYQIDQIRREDVIVSDGRQSWSLEFGLKQ